MFLPFLDNLRKTGVPVSLREYLTFLEAMRAGLVTYDVEGFYYLARAAMVKDERHIDRFDRAFAEAFRGLEELKVGSLLHLRYKVRVRDLLAAAELALGTPLRLCICC